MMYTLTMSQFRAIRTLGHSADMHQLAALFDVPAHVIGSIVGNGGCRNELRVVPGDVGLSADEQKWAAYDERSWALRPDLYAAYQAARAERRAAWLALDEAAA